MENQAKLTKRIEELEEEMKKIEIMAPVRHFPRVHSNMVNAIAISADNRYMVSGSDDKSIKIFDLMNRREIDRMADVHNDGIWSVAISSDNRYKGQNN